MKIISTGHRHLIYIVKRNTKTDSMGPFYSFGKDFDCPEAEWL